MKYLGKILFGIFWINIAGFFVNYLQTPFPVFSIVTYVCLSVGIYYGISGYIRLLLNSK